MSRLKNGSTYGFRSASRLLAVFIAAAISFASTTTFAQGAIADKPPAGGPRRQLGTIIYAGLGGAVLGLSTLSFYGRPQDKLANIAIGFAVGVICGTAAVTYSAATNPDDFYGSEIRRAEFDDDRVAKLGPGTSFNVVANEKPDAFSQTISASREVFSF